MKIRPSILVWGMVVLITMVILIVLRTKHPAQNVPATPVLTDNSETTFTLPARTVTATSTRENFEPPGPAPLPAEDDTPIVFYGKLEDQAADPVAEAEITGTTIYHVGAIEQTGQFTTTSDVDGFFKLEAGMGASLEMIPRKAGYALAATNNGGFYTRLKPEAERQHPDPNNPVVIKMWKLQGAEPLTAIDQHYNFLYPSNSPLYFDLIAGEMLPSGGDIKVTINRPPGTVSPGNPQEWSVEVEGVEGGIMDVTRAQWRTTYWAPADGYQPKIVYLMSASLAHEWSGSLDATMFGQTREGSVYTKLNLKIGINATPDDPVTIDLHGIVNTNGSCDWEGDPNTFLSE